MRIGFVRSRRTYFQSSLTTIQWQLHQARRGLLPDFHEAGLASSVRGFFTGFPSFKGTWERVKSNAHPELVEWVDLEPVDLTR